MHALGASGRVTITIDKRLPVQGGLGAGSGNAVAALLAIERALKKELPGAERLRIASEVGSDLPLFLVGGTVLGVGRGEEVYPLPDLPSVCCVVATPEIGVSTPAAFADWDRMITVHLGGTYNVVRMALPMLSLAPDAAFVGQDVLEAWAQQVKATLPTTGQPLGGRAPAARPKEVGQKSGYKAHARICMLSALPARMLLRIPASSFVISKSRPKAVTKMD